MKIEKINDNQIKLTLTGSDLKENNINLEELIKPTDKTQELFRTLMEKALSQCGFRFDDAPLMVEATPVSVDGLMIIVTKLPENNSKKDSLDIIKQNKTLRRYKKKGVSHYKTPVLNDDNLIIYAFTCFDDAIDASVRISHIFTGFSELYKLKEKHYLILQSEKSEDSENVESILCEYGTKYTSNILSKYFIMEHGNILIHNPAVKIISDNFSWNRP